MDKKYIERPKKFDKRNYYKQVTLSLTPELKERFDQYCSKEKISRSEFIKRALDVLEEK